MSFTMEQFRLAGKVAIVTGAGGRGNSIGRAYALGLANAGAAVVVADINEQGAGAVAAEINAAGGTAIGVRVDIGDIHRTFYQLSRHLGLRGATASHGPRLHDRREHPP